jgi:hypothetical protein
MRERESERALYERERVRESKRERKRENERERVNMQTISVDLCQ